MTPKLIKSFTALAAVAGCLIVKAGAGGVAQAAGSADLSIGISDAMGAALGGQLDVVQGGWAEVRCGGVVAFGDRLTSDAQSRAIKAVAGVAAVNIVAIAMGDGVADDIIPCLVVPSMISPT